MKAKYLKLAVVFGVLFISIFTLHFSPACARGSKTESSAPVSIHTAEQGDNYNYSDEPASYFDRGLIAAFFGIFLLGLALNLTPCVYPMLAVTVSVFGVGQQGGNLRAFLRSLVYVLGIGTMYSVLGTVASFTGGLFGGLLQSRWVISLIALVFFLLSLSMFGLYEIQLPAALISRLRGNKNINFLGLYISGLFVGVFAAPCVGPPVIGLLTLVGYRGDPLFGFAAFFVLSAGLGLPYLLLGTFSGLLSKIPKSGEWMSWVRKVLGIILAAVGFFYTSLAFNPQMTFLLIPFVLASGGIYLGFFEKSSYSSPGFVFIKRSVGVLLTGLAFILYFAGRTPSAEWESYSPGLVEESFESKGASIMYFSADWCIPCLELDLRTFNHSSVIQDISEFNLIKVDLTNYDSPRSQDLREKFEIAGVPTIIFLDKFGQELRGERIVGFVSAEEFKDRLARVKEFFEGRAGDKVYADKDEKVLSQMKLISDVQWVQPGSAFNAGVLFQMKEGWHTYWINPGDSGMEAQIEWNLPSGFSAGDIRWPAPERFKEGSLTTFGHEDKLLIYRQVQTPAGLKAGTTIHIRVDASWLVCRDMCIPQEGAGELTLTVKKKKPGEKENWTAIFTETAEMIPVSDPAWSFAAVIEGDYITLEAFPPDFISEDIMVDSEFFPLQQDMVRVGDYEWRRSENYYRKRMRLENSAPELSIFEGVLVFPERFRKVPRVLSVKAEINSKK